VWTRCRRGRTAALTLAVALAGAAGAIPADAQENAVTEDLPAADAALRDSLRATIERLAAREQGMLMAMERGDSTVIARAGEGVEDLRATLDSLLERVVLHTRWGGEELDRLRSRYPGAVILERYAARLALHEGRHAEALRQIDRLLARSPGDAALHRLRADALEALNRRDDARMAYLRALDLAPGSEPTFRALLRLADSSGLPSLLEHIRRMRRMEPDRAVLLDREIELLQRMGRLTEARALQDTSGGAS
jgi:tetratricopeptide (TPR) repeat protein